MFNIQIIENKIPLSFSRHEQEYGKGMSENIWLHYDGEIKETLQISTLRCEVNANNEIFIAENGEAVIVFWKLKNIRENTELLNIWILQNYVQYHDAGKEFIEHFDNRVQRTYTRYTIRNF